jgi:hypothetical protein
METVQIQQHLPFSGLVGVGNHMAGYITATGDGGPGWRSARGKYSSLLKRKKKSNNKSIINKKLKEDRSKKNEIKMKI